MLVLNRKAGQRIMIGTNIVLTVIEVKEENGETVVKLGIDAPKHITVDREELRVKRSNRINEVIGDGKNPSN